MKMSTLARAVVIGIFIASCENAIPCSWAIGYFYQVQNLRGSVVGVNRGDPRQMSRWMRQRVTLSDMLLTLRVYQWPVAKLEDQPLVRRVKSDRDGHFDFGTVPAGHYMLIINTPWSGEDIYDVQIPRNAKQNASVTIDISPNFPDCTGGHELIINN